MLLLRNILLFKEIEDNKFVNRWTDNTMTKEKGQKDKEKSTKHTQKTKNQVSFALILYKTKYISLNKQRNKLIC